MNARIALCFAALLLSAPAWSQTRGEQRGQDLLVGSPAETVARGQLLLPEFAALADKASETLTVTMDSDLLNIARNFLDSADPEDSKALKLIDSLQGIYVRSYKFETDFAYPKKEIDAVRRQLQGPGWTPMVQATQKAENKSVDVFMLISGGKAQGLAIIASEPREFTIVNIVGNIELQQLRELGALGVPPVDIETDQKSAPPKTPPPKKK